MSKLKIAYIVDAIIALGLVIGLPFVFDNSFNNNQDLFITYIVCKTVFGLLFLIGLCFGLFNKSKTFSSTVVVTLASLMQLVPMGIRFLLIHASFLTSLISSITITSLCVLIFIPVWLGMWHADFAMNNRLSESKSSTIQVHEEKRTLSNEK